MTKITENIFGMQLRRLSDLVGEQGREAFWRTGLALDAKLNSITTALFEYGALSSTEIAKITGLSRQLVESRLKKLEQADYVVSHISPEDPRKRLFEVSTSREAEIECAVATIVDFEKVYDALWDEIGVDLSDAVDKLERALRSRDLTDRLCDCFPKYKKKLKDAENAA